KRLPVAHVSIRRCRKGSVTPVPASVQRNSKHSVTPAHAGAHGRWGADGRCFVAEQTSLGPRLRGDDGSTGGRKRRAVAPVGGGRRIRKPVPLAPASVGRNRKRPVTPVPASVQRSSKHSVTPAQAGVHGRWGADGRCFIAEQTSLGPRLRGDDGSKT